jgi:hypothetical protein
MPKKPPRVRVWFDTEEKYRRAVNIRAARTGKDPKEVFVEMVESFLSKELQEAIEAIQEEEEPTTKKKKPPEHS